MNNDPPFNASFPAPAPARQALRAPPRRVPPARQAPPAFQPAPTKFAAAAFPPLPPPAGQQPPKLIQRKEKSKLWTDLILTRSFSDGRTISKEEGGEVFNLIYWFLCELGYGFNAQHLFSPHGAQQFEKFLNYLEKGAATDLFSEYFHRYLCDRDLQYSAFISEVVHKTNEEENTSHSKAYFLGFGKSSKIPKKMQYAFIKLESGYGENLAPNTTRQLASNHHSARSTTPLHTTQSTPVTLRHGHAPRTLQDEAVTTATNDTMAVDTPEAQAQADEQYSTTAPSTVGGSFNSVAAGGGATKVAAPVPPPAPFVAAAATTSAFEGVVPPKGVPPSAPFAATPIPQTQTPKSEWQSSTASRTLQLERRQLFSTASRTHRRHNTPSHSTTQTSLKTPLPTANLQEVQTHLMTASRGESILENLYLEDAESVASFGMNGDKWDTHRLMDLRDNFHPLFRELSNHRMFSKYLEKIESDPMFVVQMSRLVAQAEKHTGADSYIVTLNNQVKIVQNEQDEFSMRNGRINQIKNVASDKTTVLVEQSLHDTEEEVQNLIKQNEELDRERKKQNEELDRERKEMNEVFDRKKKDVDRKIKELRGAYEKKKETFLHNENLNTVNAGKYEKNLVERNTIVKEENARRLAIPLARRKCDKMAMELLEQAMSLQDPSYGATDDDRVKFQKQKDDFFHFLNLVEVEDGDNVLIDEAFQLLYG